MNVKNTKKCSKCNSLNIVRIPGRVDSYGASVIPIGVTIFSAVKVTKYLCSECGYLEQWVDAKSDIERVVGKYK